MIPKPPLSKLKKFKKLKKRKQLNPSQKLIKRLCKKYFAPDYKP
jgi:hypothetical protein